MTQGRGAAVPLSQAGLKTESVIDGRRTVDPCCSSVSQQRRLAGPIRRHLMDIYTIQSVKEVPTNMFVFFLEVFFFFFWLTGVSGTDDESDEGLKS